MTQDEIAHMYLLFHVYGSQGRVTQGLGSQNFFEIFIQHNIMFVSSIKALFLTKWQVLPENNVWKN